MPKLPLIALLLLTPIETAIAQTTPSQRDLIPPKPQPNLLPTPAPLDDPLLEISPFEPPTFPEIKTFPTSITITEFKFSGNTIFSDEQLLEALKPHLNRELAFTQLQEIKQIITELYQSNGYITTRAYLPASENQRLNPKNTTITLGIEEGTVEEIQITGANRLRSYIHGRLKHAENDVFSREKLLEALRLLQASPLLENVSAEIQPGTGPNTTILMVSAVPSNPFEINLGLNNHRSPAVGSFERKAALGYTNVLGFGDSISAGYSNTDGSDVFSGDYAIPINAKNGTVGIAFNYIESQITEEPFDLIDIEGSSSITQLTYRQPIVQKASETSIEELALGISASRYESENSILGVPFPLSEGADANGQIETSVVRFFQDWSKSSRKQAIALRSQFSAGLDLFTPTINANAPDGRFFVWQGQGEVIRELPHRLQFKAKGQLNLAAQTLLGIEQLSIGGTNSVRGYRQNALLRDNGALGSVEVSIPVLTKPQHAVQVSPFVDFGTGWNFQRADPVPGPDQQNTLLSAGLALSYQFKSNLSAQVDWGLPLIALEAQGNSLQENGVTLSLQWKN